MMGIRHHQTGKYLASKKELKGLVGNEPNFEETSMFGAEYKGDGRYAVVGPDPYRSRKWYATVHVKDGKIAKVEDVEGVNDMEKLNEQDMPVGAAVGSGNIKMDDEPELAAAGYRWNTETQELEPLDPGDPNQVLPPMEYQPTVGEGEEHPNLGIYPPGAQGKASGSSSGRVGLEGSSDSSGAYGGGSRSGSSSRDSASGYAEDENKFPGFPYNGEVAEMHNCPDSSSGSSGSSGMKKESYSSSGSSSSGSAKKEEKSGSKSSDSSSGSKSSGSSKKEGVSSGSSSGSSGSSSADRWGEMNPQSGGPGVRFEAKEDDDEKDSKSSGSKSSKDDEDTSSDSDDARAEEAISAVMDGYDAADVATSLLEYAGSAGMSSASDSSSGGGKKVKKFKPGREK